MASSVNAKTVKMIREKLGVGMHDAKDIAAALSENVKSDMRLNFAAQILAGFAANPNKVWPANARKPAQSIIREALDSADHLIEEHNKDSSDE